MNTITSAPVEVFIIGGELFGAEMKAKEISAATGGCGSGERENLY